MFMFCTFTAIIKKFRDVLFGLQNDEVITSRSEGVKQFVTLIRVLTVKFNLPAQVICAFCNVYMMFFKQLYVSGSKGKNFGPNSIF